MPWERRRYRRNKAWIAIDTDGEAVLDDRGLLALRYKPGDERTYTVRPDEVEALASHPEGSAPAGSTGPLTIHAHAVVDPEGGGAGLGVLLRWRGHEREIQRHLEGCTPAEAAREAVRAGLRAVRRPELPTVLRTPHAQALDAPGDTDADRDLRAQRDRFSRLEVVAVPPGGAEATDDDGGALEDADQRAAQLARDGAGAGTPG